MKQRTLISVVGVLLVVAVIGFVLTGEEPLYGQGNQRVPDLRGVWRGESSFYFFLDVTDPTDLPVFVQTPPGEFIIITDQTGGVFAGKFDDEH